MATTISKLAILLSLNSQGVTSGVGAAGGAIKKLDSDVGGLGTKLGDFTLSKVAAFGSGMLAAAAASFTFESALSAIGGSLQRLDDLAKVVDKLGVNAEDLQRINYAAGLNTTLDDAAVAKSLQNMVRRLAEAEEGSGATAEALDRVGLSVEKLRALSVTDQFLAVADAMKAIDDQGERVRLAFDLFGKEGVEMVTLLQGGSGAVKQLMSDLETTFSREQLAQVEAANDAWSRLETTWTSMSNTAAVNLAPELEDLASRLKTISSAALEADASLNGLGKLSLEAAVGSMSGGFLGYKMFSAFVPRSEMPDMPGDSGLGADAEQTMAEAEAASKAAEAKSREMDQLAAELTAASDAAVAKLKADSESLRLSLLTPIEEAVEELERLNELKGFGRLTDETQARAAESIWEKAKAQILKDNKLEIKPFVDPSAGLAERGTAAAFSAERQATNTLKEMLEQQKATAEHAAEQTRLLEDLKTAFKEAGVVIKSNSL